MPSGKMGGVVVGVVDVVLVLVLVVVGEVVAVGAGTAEGVEVEVVGEVPEAGVVGGCEIVEKVDAKEKSGVEVGLLIDVEELQSPGALRDTWERVEKLTLLGGSASVLDILRVVTG